MPKRGRPPHPGTLTPCESEVLELLRLDLTNEQIAERLGIPEWQSGVHTHDDGIIHLHPFDPSEEGVGAALGKFFEYGGGGFLTKNELRMPGSDTTYTNGDACPDGTTGVVQAFVQRALLDDHAQYIPQDGDSIQIIFGPEGSVAIETPSPVCAPPSCSPTPPAQY